MKKAYLFALSSLLVSLVGYFILIYTLSDREKYEKFLENHPYTKRLTAGENEMEKINGGEEKGDRPDLAMLQDYMRTIDPQLKRPTPLLLLPYMEASAMMRDGKITSRQEGGTLSTSITWTERGPKTVAGRIRAVMFDPNDLTNKKVWAGSTSGGLWYNNDITSSTSSWVKVNDFWDNLAVSSIAADPLNSKVFYVSTGEFEFQQRGGGIWKTTDGGATWNRLINTQGFIEIRDVAVRNENGVGVVYAAVKPGFGMDNPSYASGLYRSADGGTTWTQVLPFAQGSTQYVNFPTDISIGSDNTIWVGTAKHIWVDGATSTIYKSTSGLAGTWTAISSFTTSNLKFNGQIVLVTAPSNPQTIYAAIENDGKIGGIFKTTNGGVTWASTTLPISADTGIPANDFTRGQAWYDLTLAVNPTDANICIIGGIDLYRTTNGGGTWQQISKWSNNSNMGDLKCSLVHADQHNIILRPNFPNELVAVNDGGIYYCSSVNSATTNDNFSSRNLNFNITQFYSGAIHPISTNYMLGGTQDNGTPRFTQAGFGATDDVYGGDGAQCHIDQLDPQFQLVSYTYNTIGYSVDGGNSFSVKLIDDNNSGNFINIGDYDSNLKALFTAKKKTSIYRVTQITSWPKVDSINLSLGSMASAIRVSPYSTSSSNVYVGTQAGRLFKIANATSANPVVKEITGPSFGTGSISCIAFGAREDQLTVSFFNYGVINIWESRDGGTTWLNREGNLPNMPVRWMEYHPENPDQAFIATELGVWSTDNINIASPVWNSTNGGLANVRTDMLRIRKGDGTLMASTYGRGVFTATIPSAKTYQTISFTAITPKIEGESTFQLSATSSSGLPISYASSNPQVASISGSTVTIKAAGKTIITASQTGNASFNGASPVAQLFLVNVKPSLYCKASHTSPNCNADHAYIQSLIINDSNDNTILNNIGSGCPVNSSGTVGYTDFTGISGTLFQGRTYNGIVTRNSGGCLFVSVFIDYNNDGDFADTNEMVYQASSANKCGDGQSTTFPFTVPANASLKKTRMRVRVAGSGEGTIASSCQSFFYGETEDYSINLVNTKLSQEIVFGTLPVKKYGDSDFTLAATGGGSGNPITFASSNSQVATINGNVLKIVGAGSTVITASQPGNETYNPAADVFQTLTVNKANQTITFAALPAKAFGSSAFTLTATGGDSGLPVTFVSSNTAVATISGNTVTIVAAGTTNIIASQAGTANYDAATNVLQALTVNKANQTITFAALPDKLITDNSFALTATASSNLTVAYSTTSDKITISGSQVTLVKAGRVSIVANQAGNESFNAATAVTQSFCIKPAKPTIALSNANTETITLTSSAVAGNQWYLAGTAIAGATNQTLAVTTQGIYKVQVKADDCISEFSTDQTIIVTGDIKLDGSAISISPNPVDNVLQLNGIVGEIKSNHLFDMTGRASAPLILEKKNEVYQASVEHLNPGVYLLRIVQESKVLLVKFIKK